MNTADTVIAVINTSEDVATMLALAVEQEGFRSAITYVTDLREGRVSLASFLHEHEPRALIWDIAIPYERNWQFFQECQRSEQMQGRPVILTTTNKNALESLVGPTGTLEIVGKPYDLDELMAKVRAALPQR
jgi:DNA-binding response OmpR family regulator